jgi:dTDP-4-dehydrorhamnose reductase
VRLGTERGEVDVVFDQVGSPTWTGHLAPAILDVAEARGAGIFHATGGGSCSWFELAVEAMRLAGLDCRVRAVTTEEFPRPAPRPAFSVLESERGVVLAPWQDGVAGHIEERVTA